MKRFRLVSCLLISFMLMAGGCTLNLTWTDGPIADHSSSALPDPEGQDPNGQDPPPPLDEAQQARADEAAKYTRVVTYQGATITRTIQLPSGDIIDGLDRNTLPAVSDVLPPLPWTPADLQLPPGVERGIPDF